jgi:hypothetical protein
VGGVALEYIEQQKRFTGPYVPHTIREIFKRHVFFCVTYYHRAKGKNIENF